MPGYQDRPSTLFRTVLPHHHNALHEHINLLTTHSSMGFRDAPEWPSYTSPPLVSSGQGVHRQKPTPDRHSHWSGPHRALAESRTPPAHNGRSPDLKSTRLNS